MGFGSYLLQYEMKMSPPHHLLIVMATPNRSIRWNPWTKKPQSNDKNTLLFIFNFITGITLFMDPSILNMGVEINLNKFSSLMNINMHVVKIFRYMQLICNIQCNDILL